MGARDAATSGGAVSTTLLVVSLPGRLAIAATVFALAVAFAGARRAALALLVVLLAVIAAGIHVTPSDTTHERERTHRR